MGTDNFGITTYSDWAMTDGMMRAYSFWNMTGNPVMAECIWSQTEETLTICG